MRRPLLVVLVVAACATTAVSTATTPDELFVPLVAERAVPGLSVAVVNNGTLVMSRGYGTTAVNRGPPAGPDTQYRLASVSKAFTATGVMALVQDGKVELDEPAHRYCPVLTALNGAPTVRHFLMHRSGMRHTSDAEDTTITAPRLSDSLKAIVTEPLRFSPARQIVLAEPKR